MASRRGFLVAGLGVLLTGCATSTRRDAQILPGPTWDETLPTTVTEAPALPAPTRSAGGAQCMPRSAWAAGRPVPTLMRPMKPARYITVHHDGMRPFMGEHERAAAARLEAIRRGHRRRNWGDIGYHFAVDRTGNIWEGRPIGFQGAHVKDHNEGNVGIVVLGNFDQQEPTSAQLLAVREQVNVLMRTYRIPLSRVRTHKEWAPTRCPGASLQRRMVAMRGNGLLA
jgi:hypothetical protein